jgi:hypothetical protein
MHVFVFVCVHVCCVLLLVLQVIKRMGKWLHDAMYTNYLSFFKTEGLLAMGGWPHAERKDFGHFYAERFDALVKELLMHMVFPFIPDVKQRLAGLERPDPSMKSIVEVLEYLAVVVVQDAMQLLSEGIGVFSENSQQGMLATPNHSPWLLCLWLLDSD